MAPRDPDVSPAPPAAARTSAKTRLKRFLLTTSVGRWMLVPYRLGGGLGYFRDPLAALFRWLITSRELANYTYDLTDRNKQHLAAAVAIVTGVEVTAAARYITELDEDEVLRAHIIRRTGEHPRGHIADPAARYGRRAGWYAMVRATKPKVVVETGVDKGLGTCVLAAALIRNADEGHPGAAYSTDIDPEAGYLLGPPYDRVARVLYGDSLESLRRLDARVDLFINDSDHSADYEAREYETILPKLSERAVILADNAHVTDALYRFAQRTGRRFLFFREEPLRHWYSGAGIGFAYGPGMNET